MLKPDTLEVVPAFTRARMRSSRFSSMVIVTFFVAIPTTIPRVLQWSARSVAE